MYYDPICKPEPTMPVENTTAHDLLRAADRLRWKGHCKGMLVGNDGEYCVMGAILVVTGSSPISVATERALNATKALIRHLDGNADMNWFGLWGAAVDWNNAEERTADQVIGALEAAAAEEMANVS
jgi:hypothetical protein